MGSRHAETGSLRGWVALPHRARRRLGTRTHTRSRPRPNSLPSRLRTWLRSQVERRRLSVPSISHPPTTPRTFEHRWRHPGHRRLTTALDRTATPTGRSGRGRLICRRTPAPIRSRPRSCYSSSTGPIIIGSAPRSPAQLAHKRRLGPVAGGAGRPRSSAAPAFRLAARSDCWTCFPGAVGAGGPSQSGGVLLISPRSSAASTATAQRCRAQGHSAGV